MSGGNEYRQGLLGCCSTTVNDSEVQWKKGALQNSVKEMEVHSLAFLGEEKR